MEENCGFYTSNGVQGLFDTAAVSTSRVDVHTQVFHKDCTKSAYCKKPSIYIKVKSIPEVNWNTFLWKKRWGWILNCCSDLPKVPLKIMGCGAFGVYCLHLCKHFVGFYSRPKSIVQVQPVVDRHRRKPTKYKYRKGNQSHQLSARKINTIYENNDDGLQWW